MKNHRPMPSWCPTVARIVPAAIMLGVAGVVGLAPALRADIDPVTGIDLITIGAPGNANWTGSSLYNSNHGRVDYTFSIGKYEVTTAQWVEFMNAAFDRPAGDALPHVHRPLVWGAQGTTPTNPGRSRWIVPAGREMIPTGGIDWRTAAIYANFLHNGKATNREAFLNGAYDVSTFGYLNGGSAFTDQLTRSPGARYWIPSLDEWMKAAHYDPAKPNPDGTLGGWWEYSTTSDTRPIYGPPGVLVNGQPTQANSSWRDFEYPGRNPYAVPLGAYANVLSPWGLRDVAGGTSEWTEGYFQIDGEPVPRDRFYEGSGWNGSADASDRIASLRGDFPTILFDDIGLRIASNVPTPCTGFLGAGVVVWSLVRKRRRTHYENAAMEGSVGGGARV